LSQTKLCLGTVQFGLNYGVNNSVGKPSQASTFAMLDEALKQGITMIDTATAYGTAEELLGQYAINKHHVHVISKLRPNFISKDCPNTEVIVEEQIKASLVRTGLSELDGYLIHTPENYYNKKIINGLRLCKEKGLIRHFGVSIYEIEHALDVVRDGIVDYIQIPYSIFDQRVDQTEFFKLAKENKITVFARSAFLQGLILMAEKNIPAHLAVAKEYLRKFDQIINKHGFTRIQAAFLFSYTHPGIDYLVFGVEKMEQLRENIELSRRQFDFTDCRQEISNSFRDVSKSIIFPSLWKEKKVN